MSSRTDETKTNKAIQSAQATAKYLSCYSPEDKIPLPCGHPAVHTSLSSASLWTHLQLLARRQRLLRLLCSASLSNVTVFFALKPLGDPRTPRVSEKDPLNCLKPCGFLSRGVGNGRLTLMLTQAELLTEILGHHTRARAVAGMVWVITWLVVVHLIGWVIWIKRRESSDWHKKCFRQWKSSLKPFLWGEHTLFKLDFCPQPAMKKNRCWV